MNDLLGLLGILAVFSGAYGLLFAFYRIGFTAGQSHPAASAEPPFKPEYRNVSVLLRGGNIAQEFENASVTYDEHFVEVVTAVGGYMFRTEEVLKVVQFGSHFREHRQS